jgi:UDP-2,3-diacylglucosamine hydrolase
MNNRTKYYFISDFHLGVPTPEKSKIREKKIVEWLEYASKDAKEIYLVGDLFDFWFEYKTVVPKGYTRFLGKIAELTDKGISIHVFTGNHDMWSFGYLPEELGIKLHKKPIFLELNSKKIMLGHGDGLGPGDTGYKIIKKIFANPICQWLFAWIHPDLGIGLANYFSRKSRAKGKDHDEVYHGDEKEFLVQYCKKKESEGAGFDYYIFGHRHLPLEIKISEKSTYINLGEWLSNFTYAVFDGEKMELKKWE